jgi:uncharacterized membrane protein SpoIIM required for sporulation
VIIDLGRFLSAERAYWDELEAALRKLETEPERRLPLAEIQRLHYLYERCSSDLSRLDTFATEPRLRAYLESLVSRAYSVIHETRARVKIRWRAAAAAFPRAFRRHPGAFRMAVGVTLLGCLFGWFALQVDARNKAILMPFAGLMVSPAERVAQEERAGEDHLKGVKASFAAQLMTHNTQVTVMALALGVTFGVGTLVLLFYNGVILGAVATDYLVGGQGLFLAGWLLPHGSVEIPAILFGGQAGFILAGALIGWGDRTPRVQRLRAVTPDLVAIVAGAGVLLIWAGIVEAFVSQYHQPVIPYGLKIAFGLCELAALSLYLGRVGRE